MYTFAVPFCEVIVPWTLHMTANESQSQNVLKTDEERMPTIDNEQ